MVRGPAIVVNAMPCGEPGIRGNGFAAAGVVGSHWMRSGTEGRQGEPIQQPVTV